MTVTKEMISVVSPFTVSATGDFTEADFTQYKTWAEAELDRDNPGLPTAIYDQAHALLICDIFETSRGSRDMKSEKIGDYSYSRDDSGKTTYRLRYEALLSKWSEQPSESITRADKDTEEGMPGQFMLDQRPVAEFEEQ